MNKQEALATNGGAGWLKWAIRAIEFLGVVEAITEFVDGFKEGYNEARSSQHVDAVSGATS
jgi:hypothetical protein